MLSPNQTNTWRFDWGCKHMLKGALSGRMKYGGHAMDQGHRGTKWGLIARDIFKVRSIDGALAEATYATVASEQVPDLIVV